MHLTNRGKWGFSPTHAPGLVAQGQALTTQPDLLFQDHVGVDLAERSFPISLLIASGASLQVEKADRCSGGLN